MAITIGFKIGLYKVKYIFKIGPKIAIKQF